MVATLDVYMTLEYPSAIPPELRDRRGFILHDHQSVKWNYLPRVSNPDGTPKLIGGKPYGLPETEKGDTIFEPMEREWQEFWFGWLKYYSPPSFTLKTIKQKWADLTDGGKAFTNKHGSDLYADYINGTNLDKSPMAQESPLTTCGNMVILSGNNRSSGGLVYKGVLCLDRSYPPPALPDELVSYFIHAATVCRPEKVSVANYPRNASAPNGRFRVNHFPHTGGNKVPVPFVCSRGEQKVFMGVRVRENWIRADRLCPLDDDEFPATTV